MYLKMYSIMRNKLLLFKRSGKFLLMNPNTVRWRMITDGDVKILDNSINNQERLFEENREFYFDAICSGLIELNNKNIKHNKCSFNIPRIVYWGVTSQCNLKCSYCYANADSIQGKCTEENANVILNEIIRSNVTEVVFTGGEPLLLPNIILYAQKLKDYNIFTSLITNGVLLSRYSIKELEVFDRISISLDGTRSEVNDRTRGNGVFDIVSKNIGNYCKLHKNIGILMTIGTHNINNVLDMIDYAYKELEVKFLRFQFFFPNGRGKEHKDLSISTQQMIEIQEKILSHIVKNKLYLKDPESIFMSNRQGNMCVSCGAGKAEIFIDENANVYPCRLLVNKDYCMGNINTSQLNNIFIPASYKNSPTGFNIDRNAQCSKCNFKKMCGGGCRASHASYTCDLLENSQEFCQYLKNELELTMYLNSVSNPEELI